MFHLQGVWWKAHEIYSRQQNIGYITFSTQDIKCLIEKPEAACLEFDVGKFKSNEVKSTFGFSNPGYWLGTTCTVEPGSFAQIYLNFLCREGTNQRIYKFVNGEVLCAGCCANIV